MSSALAERVCGGYYVDVTVDRQAAARYGHSVADVQSVVAREIGGETIGETIEGRRRFLVSVRYPRELRDSVADLKALPFFAESRAQRIAAPKIGGKGTAPLFSMLVIPAAYYLMGCRGVGAGRLRDPGPEWLQKADRGVGK